MKYRSTNGSMEFEGIPFEETLYHGYLPDGGLIVPKTIPELSKETLKQWSDLSYKELALEFLMLFIDEDFMKKDQLEEIIARCYQKFPDEVVPLTEVSSNNFVAELFHGETLAFKDLGMVMATALLEFSLKKRNKRALVYVATSGDTGSAAISAIKNNERIEALVLLPGGNRISEVQRLQMTTVHDQNIRTFDADCFCATFDDFLLDFVPKITKDFPNIIVTSLNSMLMIRVLAQTVHLLYAFFKVNRDLGPVNFVIPTGGAGHLFCGLLLQKMGVPLNLYPSFNDKNINLYNFLTGGEKKNKGEAVKSLTVAMDLFYAPNVYRLLYLWADLKTDVVKTLSEDFNKGEMKVPDDLLNKVKESITPLLCSDIDIKETIKKCFQEKSYTLDPHTACGFAHYYKQSFNPSDRPTVYMGCASPLKFVDTLALCGVPTPKEYESLYKELKGKKENCTKLPDDQKQWEEFLLPYVKEIANKSSI